MDPELRIVWQQFVQTKKIQLGLGELGNPLAAYAEAQRKRAVNCLGADFEDREMRPYDPRRKKRAEAEKLLPVGGYET